MFAILKKVVFLILLSVFLLQTFSNLIIYSEYIINKDYIAKFLCINQDKPKMGCEGKCELKKQIKEAEQKEQKRAPQAQNEKVEVLFSQNIRKTDIFKQIEVKESVAELNFINSFYSYDVIADIFHPPQNFIL